MIAARSASGRVDFLSPQPGVREMRAVRPVGLVPLEYREIGNAERGKEVPELACAVRRRRHGEKLVLVERPVDSFEVVIPYPCAAEVDVRGGDPFHRRA